MPPEDAASKSRVLLLPPTARDAEAIIKLLTHAGLECVALPKMSSVCEAIKVGTGAIVVSEESLAADGPTLAGCIDLQPVWSDLPIIVLSRAGAESQTLNRFLGRLGNLTVLERPVRLSTFLSVITTALRARERQYQVRDHLDLLAQGELERERLLESERAARMEIERASRIKDEFLATLSHELRNPLHAIVGWSQILKTKNLPPEQLDEGIQVIERNARVQTQIIEDLLDMSRIISGKVRLDVQRLDLASVVRAAIETVKPAADAKEIRLRTILDPLAGPVSGDPNRLQQVFWNLLSNAVKFTPKNGAVQIVLERVNSHVEVSVIDSGEGIDPAFLPHVFDRFRQADASTTRQHGGLGLGLAIVRQLVELHGGAVRAKSPGLGAGATFVVTLPVTVLHEESDITVDRRHPTAACSELPCDGIARLSGVRVLVVDDEPDARTLLRRVLEECEASVTTVSSAADAIRSVETRRPDVLVSDIGMPGEDGYFLIRQLRAMAAGEGGSTPAIALTAYARAEDRVKVMRAGFQHHLSKPVEPAELVAIVASLAQRAIK